MALNANKSFIAGLFAFILATSCCWLPAVALALGGATGIMAFSDTMEKSSGLLMAIGTAFFVYGGYYFYKRNARNELILLSTITCPNCGFSKKETMPTDACAFFYECDKCKSLLKPKPGDCCVYCSFGTVKCPPVQEGKDCCS